MANIEFTMERHCDATTGERLTVAHSQGREHVMVNIENINFDDAEMEDPDARGTYLTVDQVRSLHIHLSYLLSLM